MTNTNNTNNTTNNETADQTSGRVSVLDKGFAVLVDSMGSDASIVQAARVSYGPGTKTPSADRALIRYLMRHKHTTPFEMVQLKFHIKAPMFVVRQWQRHRTGSFNEMSARYTEMPDEFYEPTALHEQSVMNKQGRGKAVSGSVLDGDGIIPLPDVIGVWSGDAHVRYRQLLAEGVSREEARMVLPANLYTQFYWSVNLHNFLHFHTLRSAPDAQWEIQEYASAMAHIVAPMFPYTWEAYLEYVVRSATFSNHELLLIKSGIELGSWPTRNLFESGSAYTEFYRKLKVAPPSATAKDSGEGGSSLVDSTGALRLDGV